MQESSRLKKEEREDNILFNVHVIIATIHDDEIHHRVSNLHYMRVEYRTVDGWITLIEKI